MCVVLYVIVRSSMVVLLNCTLLVVLRSWSKCSEYSKSLTLLFAGKYITLF
jgi:hypothetical protein